MDGSWSAVIDEMTKLRANNNLWSILRRLVLGATVYYLWQERNTRLSQGKKREDEDMTRVIKGTLRLRKMSFKVKDSSA
ncbi:hypothetical protein Tco_0560858, partial [Tanacetum coccineum]